MCNKYECSEVLYLSITDLFSFIYLFKEIFFGNY